jgi:hypothetical protein
MWGRDLDAWNLYLYAKVHPPFYAPTARAYLGWTEGRWNSVVHRLREMLSHTTENLACERDPNSRGPWIWKLVSDDAAVPWMVGRVVTMRGELQTIGFMAASIVHATPPTTAFGVGMRYVRTQLGVIDTQLALLL